MDHERTSVLPGWCGSLDALEMRVIRALDPAQGRPPMIDVLIDMTPLSSRSRDRGIGRYVRSLCHTLARRAEWLPRYPGLAGARLELVGLVRHRGSTEGALDPSLNFAGEPGADTSPSAYRRYKLERRLCLGSLVHATRARVLHLPEPFGTPFDGRTPRVTTCHDLIPLLRAGVLRKPVEWLRHVARYKAAARVIAVSRATHDDLVRELGVPPERIDVVYHGVDHQRFVPQGEAGERQAVAEMLGTEQGYVLYLGAADRRKNLALLIRAFARSKLARELVLVLAGPISDRQRRALSDCARLEGITPQLRLLGYVPEPLLAALYRQCLLHVFPSSYEGFGLPVLEAMACGAPTIISPSPALLEVAGGAALALRKLEVGELTATLERLAGSQELQAELSRSGLARAAAFTWEACAAGTLESYARLVAEVAS